MKRDITCITWQKLVSRDLCDLSGTWLETWWYKVYLCPGTGRLLAVLYRWISSRSEYRAVRYKVSALRYLYLGLLDRRLGIKYRKTAEFGGKGTAAVNQGLRKLGDYFVYIMYVNGRGISGFAVYWGTVYRGLWYIGVCRNSGFYCRRCLGSWILTVL